MHKTWLIFTQSVTILVALFFVIATFKPQWLGHDTPTSSTHAPRISPVSFANNTASLTSQPNSNQTAEVSSYALAARRATPAVVSISTSKAINAYGSREDMWYQYFFGNPETPPSQDGLASGVIVSPEGYILTNNHVVKNASEIRVALADGREANATIIGSDNETDLALLYIQLDNLPVIAMGDSDQAEVGDVVLAIGNPFGVGQTVTSGIISALGRNHIGLNTFENFIQTDAAINPGNSGGALVNANGELIGINTAIFSRTGGSLGIGFAIPSSTASQVMENILTYGYVIRGWIGVEPRDLTPELVRLMNADVTSGVLIAGVLENSPAAQAGIRPGDIVQQLGNQTITNTPQLLNAVAGLTPGQATSITIHRNNQSTTLPIVPGTRPNQNRARR